VAKIKELVTEFSNSESGIHFKKSRSLLQGQSLLVQRSARLQYVLDMSLLFATQTQSQLSLNEDLSVRNAADMLSSSGTDCQLDFTSNGGIYYTWSPQGDKQLFTSFSSNRSCVSMN